MMIILYYVGDISLFHYDYSCWLSLETHTIWAFAGPAIAVIFVSTLYWQALLTFIICRHTIC